MAVDSSFDRSHNAPLVVLASDDESFTTFAAYVLEQNGLRVIEAADGRQLRATLLDRTPDVLVLESQLSDLDFCRFCAALRLDRRTRSMAVLALLAKDDEASQAEILAAGADECLARPIRPERLVACVQAALPDGTRARDRHRLMFRDIELDLAAYLVRRNGRTVHLAPTEFRLLLHLMKNPRRVHTRHELQHAAWPPHIHLGARTIDVHIGRLRQALTEAGDVDPIRTVRSVGYALSE